MRIYTKTGDSGTTSLFAGKRVAKNSARVTAYGDVDELNSLLGVIIAQAPNKLLIKKLIRVQNELFVLESDLAAARELKMKVPRVTKSYISRLEREIDLWEKELKPLKNFILPGGGGSGSGLHLARTVTRRAERSVSNLAQVEKISTLAQMYVNRLSDWFFVLARYINMEEGKSEVIWKGRGK